MAAHESADRQSGTRSLLAFILLTFIVTWTTWIAVWAISRGSEYPGAGLPMLLFYVGVFASRRSAMIFQPTRDTAFAKIRARVEGTALAADLIAGG